MALPEISFVETDTGNIESAIITNYEALAGRTLAQGDPIRLFLLSVAAIIVQQRVLIDYSAKMNLLAYAEGDYLDHIGNLVGVTLFALGLLKLHQFDAATQASFLDIGRELMHNTVFEMFSKGMLAGWIIAMMVWMMAATEQSRLAIIVICTYLIAISGFTHIIVGSAEAMYMVFAGEISFADSVVRFALPTLAGNVVGGSLIFALISHAQVRSDSH